MQELITAAVFILAVFFIYLSEVYRRRLEAHMKAHKDEYWEVGEVWNLPQVAPHPMIHASESAEWVQPKLDDGTPVYIKLKQDSDDE